MFASLTQARSELDAIALGFDASLLAGNEALRVVDELAARLAPDAEQRSLVSACDSVLAAGEPLSLLSPWMTWRQVVRRDLVVRLGRVAELGLLVGRHRTERLAGVAVVGWSRVSLVVRHG